MVNPYQTPSLVDQNADQPRVARTLQARFHAVQTAKLRSGLIWIRAGAALGLGSIVSLGIAAFFQDTLDHPALTWGASLLMTTASASMAGMWLGLLHWAALPGLQKPLCLAALVIQAIGMVATIAFAGRVMAGVFVGGMFQLYGASAFALLLTSLAMIALINRDFATSAKAAFSIRASDLAVIAYALCGTICSANALRLTTDMPELVLVGVFLVCPTGVLMQWFSHHTLLLKIAPTSEASPPDQSLLG